MARPSWKGHLRLSLVTCAVHLVPATSDSERISFHMLNPKTGNRVKQQLVDAETGDVVERSDVVKGYEYEKGTYVVIEDDELAKIKIESTHTIDVERFVDRAKVDSFYYNRPYFMLPDGRISEEAYAVIREAIKRTGMVGIGRLVLSAREHVVAIEPHDAGMALTTLRAPNEVRRARDAFEDLRDVKLEKEMVELASSIVKGKAGPFDPKMFEDRYQDALRKLVEAKAHGKRPALPKADAAPRNVVNLMDALRRSVHHSASKPPAQSKSRRASHGRSPATKRHRKAS
jgi:DNA end-binding protein Ku